MIKLVFATANDHKIQEINQILRGVKNLEVVSMSAIGCHDDIPETQPTIEGNALQKANYLYDKYQVDCFSEDTGLEIDALNGEPGVKTARYAGEPRSNDRNIDLVLQKLFNEHLRTARFRTVICLIMGGKKYLFEGVCEGIIRQKRAGTEGFGYDPIFQPQGFEMTFAELDSHTKNAISHRGKAMEKLLDFLLKLPVKEAKSKKSA